MLQFNGVRYMKDRQCFQEKRNSKRTAEGVGIERNGQNENDSKQDESKSRTRCNKCKKVCCVVKQKALQIVTFAFRKG